MSKSSEIFTIRPLDTDMNPLNLQVGDMVVRYSGSIWGGKDGVKIINQGRVIQMFSSTQETLTGDRSKTTQRPFHCALIQWEKSENSSQKLEQLQPIEKTVSRERVGQLAQEGALLKSDLSPIYLEPNAYPWVTGKVASKKEAEERKKAMEKMMSRLVSQYVNNGEDSQGTETMSLLARVSMPVVRALVAEYDTSCPRGPLL